MEYSSYERLFFPVIEVIFLVNLDLVKQNKSLQQAELTDTIQYLHTAGRRVCPRYLYFLRALQRIRTHVRVSVDTVPAPD